jgi:hypothetical protein
MAAARRLAAEDAATKKAAEPADTDAELAEEAKCIGAEYAASERDEQGHLMHKLNAGRGLAQVRQKLLGNRRQGHRHGLGYGDWLRLHRGHLGFSRSKAIQLVKFHELVDGKNWVRTNSAENSTAVRSSFDLERLNKLWHESRPRKATKKTAASESPLVPPRLAGSDGNAFNGSGPNSPGPDGSGPDGSGPDGQHNAGAKLVPQLPERPFKAEDAFAWSLREVEDKLVISGWDREKTVQSCEAGEKAAAAILNRVAEWRRYLASNGLSER